MKGLAVSVRAARTAAVSLCVIIAVFVLSGCLYTEDIIRWEIRTEIAASSGTSASQNSSEFELRYAYSSLNQEERAVYAKLKDSVFAFGQITADGCGYETFKKVFAAFCADYPECFWLTGDWSASGFTVGRVRKYNIFPPITDIQSSRRLK